MMISTASTAVYICFCKLLRQHFKVTPLELWNWRQWQWLVPNLGPLCPYMLYFAKISEISISYWTVKNSPGLVDLCSGAPDLAMTFSWRKLKWSSLAPTPCWDVSHSTSLGSSVSAGCLLLLWETAKCYVTWLNLHQDQDTATYLSCPRLGYNFSQVDSRLSKYLKNLNNHWRETAVI